MPNPNSILPLTITELSITFHTFGNNCANIRDSSSGSSTTQTFSTATSLKKALTNASKPEIMSKISNPISFWSHHSSGLSGHAASSSKIIRMSLLLLNHSWLKPLDLHVMLQARPSLRCRNSPTTTSDQSLHREIFGSSKTTQKQINKLTLNF